MQTLLRPRDAAADTRNPFIHWRTPFGFCQIALLHCPAQNNLANYYSTRTTPSSKYCPARGIGLAPATSERIDRKERDATPTRFAITDNGRRIRETIGQLNIGDKVWSMLENGTGTAGTIIGFEQGARREEFREINWYGWVMQVLSRRFGW